MYNKLKNLSVPEQAEYLTEMLVERSSMNGTDGEIQKAYLIYDIIKSFPYFKEHPEQVWIQELEKDPFRRKNVWALLKGEQAKTLLMHSHFDTVGVEDFGELEDIAHSPKALQTFFQQFDEQPELKKEAQSGDWMYGRGVLDMQSGVAVHLVNLLFYSEKSSLNGNLLFLFNADEETNHRGMIGAVDEVLRLKREGLDFLAAINTDFISPQYNQESIKRVYTGTAGKVLPSFSIYGREAHVGNALSAIEPTTLASHLVSRINYNLELMEEIDGELILPPTCLQLRDTKEQYSVQTPVSTRLYYNYFLYEKSPNDILQELKEIAQHVADEYEKMAIRNDKVYRSKHHLPLSTLQWKIEVQTLQEYVEYLTEQGIQVQDLMKKVNLEGDERAQAFEMVDILQQADPKKHPRILLFFAPPYLPSNYLSRDNSYGEFIEEQLEELLPKLQEQYNEVFAMKRFFPYLSDGSFLSIHQSDQELDELKQNIPYQEVLLPVPFKSIKELSIPSLIFGVYGNDGHQWTERLYKPYSFHKLPFIIQDVVERLLEEKP
ncbi:peptidase M20 [Bacillus coahuilensis m2-6]|uniref:M20/M25/M40 family metallo-hydrolase n=1 Tax=Bacillus coahuilensis TaxID=408580 RepID=UPI00075011D0|nr:M20/M25/M40 family metallo-hydrolase [Bacillus coahuilensis]KUP09569.1 peptidase M20 [Bacillus coahuilensis m2-6]